MANARFRRENVHLLLFVAHSTEKKRCFQGMTGKHLLFSSQKSNIQTALRNAHIQVKKYGSRTLIYEGKMDNIDETIKRIETTLERHSERLVLMEGRLANDYKAITSLVADVKNLKAESEANSKVISGLAQKVNEMEKAFKDFTESMTKAQESQELRDIALKKQMGKHNKILIGAILVSITALIYATIQNGTIASAVTTILSLAAKLGLL